MNINVETMTTEELKEVLTLSMQINKTLMNELSWTQHTAMMYIYESYLNPKIEIIKPTSSEKLRAFIESLANDYTLTGSVVSSEKKETKGLLERMRF